MIHLKGRKVLFSLIIIGFIFMIDFTNHTVSGETEVIHVNDYGIDANSRDDATAAVREALEAASKIDGPVTINFEKGDYHFYRENANKISYYISNTASESQNADVTKYIGILMKEMDNVTIEGNGSLLLFHGKMTSLVIDQSENITLQNLHIDYERPTTSEMEVKEVGDNYLTAKIHEDSLYEIENEQILWTSEKSKSDEYYWTYRDGNAQVYDPETDTMKRTWNPGASASKVEELADNEVKFYYNERPDAAIGQVFTMREDVRDEVGTFITESKNVIFDHVGMHYMHGLGVVFQYSENLNVNEVDFAPREETARVTAGFADFIQVSGGKGLIKVEDSTFSGPNDDPINVHGTHLKVVEKRENNQVVVKYEHHQTYGFQPFYPGDSLEYISWNELTTVGSAQVEEVEQIDNRQFLLTLDKPIPDQVKDNDVVENITYTPDVEIRNNHFERVPTRGILVTTRGKVLIENNTFLRPQMSSILIASDAGAWFESGMVKDVTIRNNEFIEGANPVIHVNPENTEIDWENPVHRNIHIYNNVFDLPNGMNVDVKSTAGFLFENNNIAAPSVNFEFNGSSDIVIDNNTMNASEDDRQVTLTNSNDYTIQEDQLFTIHDLDRLASVRLTSPYFQIDQTDMTATASSYQAEPKGNAPESIFDGDDHTIWHSEWSPYKELPQHITIDLGEQYEIDKLKYVPRKDGGQNGIITSYHIYVSDDGEHFDKISTGD